MKARLLDAETTLFADMDPAGRTITTLTDGTEFEFDKVHKKNGIDWVQAKLADGTAGYIKGDARVFTIKKVSLLDNEAEVREQPSGAAPVVRRISKGQNFDLLEVVQGDGKDWVRVRDHIGAIGLIPGNVKIRDVSAPVAAARPDASRDMLIGGLWCIGGTLVTLLTYKAASEGGGTYFVAWGAILFGGLQFLRGAINAARN
jgi:hypothetical protein